MTAIRPLAPPLLAAALAACSAPVARDAPAPHGSPPAALRELVVMLDGVPFEVVDSLHAAGRFRAFQPPSAVVSAFPSLTGVAFGEIWDHRPAGYEDRYFDPEANRLRGGLLAHVFPDDEDAGFHALVDVETGGILAGLAYLLPEFVARRELASFLETVHRRAAFDSTVVAYLVSTDALAHRTGRAGLVEQLLAVDGALEELLARYPGLRVTLLSDHGNELVPTRQAPLDSALEAGGFRLAGSIEGPRDVVLPRFGLVGSAVLFAAPAAEPGVAAALARAPGVDLVLFEDGLGRVHVWSRRGMAVVEGDPAAGRYRYAPRDGDPLGLAPALARMEADGTAAPDGSAPDSAWFQASLETPYVDSLRRILLAVRGAVRHPASVLVSFEPGYHFGAGAADLLVDVTGTHGSLRTESSLAFFMSTHARLPRLIRAGAVGAYLPAVR